MMFLPLWMVGAVYDWRDHHVGGVLEKGSRWYQTPTSFSICLDIYKASKPFPVFVCVRTLNSMACGNQSNICEYCVVI